MIVTLSTTTVMIVQPTQLPGRQSGPSTWAVLMFELRTQHSDPLGNISFHLFLNAAEQHGDGNIKNRRKRQSGAKRREPVTLFVSRHFRAFRRSQQKSYLLLAEAGSFAICSKIVVEA